jgi:hypothetical protein
LIRQGVGVLLAAAIGLLPVAPPEHVHEVDDHGHSHLMVHRHAAAHHGAQHAIDHDGVFDDDDTPLLTFDPTYTIPHVGAVVAPRVVIAIRLDPPPAPVSYRAPEYLERLIHGPPRAPTGLRAPPSTSRL